MKQERQFRLLSIALIGLIAVACLPEGSSFAASAAFAEDSLPTNEAMTVIVERSGTEVIPADAAIQMSELDSIKEIEQINAGDFSPYLIGQRAN